MPTPTLDYTPVLQTLCHGGIAVIPTDTVYGVVASALLPEAVERIFQLRQRDLQKAVIVLIPDIDALEQFSVLLDVQSKKFLRSVWPGKVSVILPIAEPSRWIHLHRGTDCIAFRVPESEELCAFLKQTGPLIAPSANIVGEPAATTLEEARQYFGTQVDKYIDGGTCQSLPSTLVRWTTKGIDILRPGAVQINLNNHK